MKLSVTEAPMCDTTSSGTEECTGKDSALAEPVIVLCGVPGALFVVSVLEVVAVVTTDDVLVTVTGVAEEVMGVEGKGADCCRIERFDFVLIKTLAVSFSCGKRKRVYEEISSFSRMCILSAQADFLCWLT